MKSPVLWALVQVLHISSSIWWKGKAKQRLCDSCYCCASKTDCSDNLPLVFPWSKREVEIKHPPYSLVLPASPTPGQEVGKSTLQNCISVVLLPTSHKHDLIPVFGHFIKVKCGTAAHSPVWCVKPKLKLLLWWKPYGIGILSLMCLHS